MSAVPCTSGPPAPSPGAEDDIPATPDKGLCASLHPPVPAACTLPPRQQAPRLREAHPPLLDWVTQPGLAAHNHLSFLIPQEDSLDSEEPCSRPESLQGKGTAKAVEGTACGLQERLRCPAPNHTGTSSPSDGPGSPPGSQGPGFYLMHPCLVHRLWEGGCSSA